jgi:hypothetical protein
VLDPGRFHANQTTTLLVSGVATVPKTPRDLAEGMAERRQRRLRDDGFVRETFVQARDDARRTARAFLERFPKQAYMSEVERWRETPDGAIEFTMRRLRTAD